MTHLGTYRTPWHYYFDGEGVNQRYEIRIYLVSQNIANNTSDVRVEMYAEQYGWFSTSGGRHIMTGTIDGTNYNRDVGIRPTGGFGLVYVGAGTKTISHNSNGSKTITVSGAGRTTGTTYGFEKTLYTGAKSITLPNIPRATTISSFTRDNITLNSFRVNWSTAHTVDRVRYRTRVGTGSWTSWATGQTGDRTSGNFTISGLNPDTTYGVQIEVRRKDSQITTESSQANVKTLNVATLTSVPNNIDIEEPFTVTFARNGASNVNIGIYDTAGVVGYAPYRVATGTSYTFNLTQAEKDALYSDMVDVTSKTYRIYLNTNDNAYRKTADRTFVITDANPVFTNWTYADINPTTLALTGNNQKVVKGLSDVRATVSVANKMVPQKKATAVNYTFVAGNKTEQKAYSNSSAVTLDITGVSSDSLVVRATDSRQLTTEVVKDLGSNFLEYAKPNIENVKLEREGDVSTTTKLTFNGTWWNDSFGAQSNTLTMHYRYKRATVSNYGETWYPITATTSGNTFSFAANVHGDLGAEGFSADSAFDVQIRVRDKFIATTEHIYTTFLGSGVPLLAFGEQGVAFGAPYDESLGGSLQVDGQKVEAIDFDKIYPVGAIYMSVNSTSPATLFGGTWSRWGNGRVPVGVDTSQTEFDTVEKTGGAKTHTLTVAQMPSHNHTASTNSTGAHIHNMRQTTVAASGSARNVPTASGGSVRDDWVASAGAHSHTVTVANSGSGNAHNNLQPYITCYMWVRTA